MKKQSLWKTNRKKYFQEYYKNNMDKIKSRRKDHDKKYRDSHKEQLKEKGRIYREKQKCVKQQQEVARK